MRGKATLIALCLLALMVPARRAAAAEEVPGDSCTGAGLVTNSFIWAGGPQNGGVINGLFCNGSTWAGVINFQSSGNVGIGTTAPGSLLDVGLAGTTLGTLRLEGNTSGYVQIQPAAAAGSWTATLPATAGTSGYVLSTDGTGITSWISNAGTASTALSSITAAASGHTIANANNAQVWNWDTLTNGTALTIGSTSMTTGKLLSLSNTNGAASTGTVLNVSNAETGAAFAIKGTASGATGASTGVYGRTNSTTANATGVAGIAAGATGAGWGVYGEADSTSDNAVGVYGNALGATGAVWGVYAQTGSTSAGAGGIWGNAYGATGAIYGVKGQTASAAGFGVYGINSASGGIGIEGVANTGTGVGVYGSTSSTTNWATGVSGYASGATGQTAGGYFKTLSTSDWTVGVVGWASAATGGFTVGVYGESDSGNGTAARFEGYNGSNLLNMTNGDSTVWFGPDMNFDGGADGNFWFANFGTGTGSTEFHWNDGVTDTTNFAIANSGGVAVYGWDSQLYAADFTTGVWKAMIGGANGWDADMLYINFKTDFPSGVEIGGWGSNSDLYVTGNTIVSGNVGIGTNVPGSQLEIERSALAASAVGIILNSPDAYSMKIYQPITSTDLRIWGEGNGDLLTIQQGGNVGIGTTGPGTALDVNGGITADPATVNLTADNQTVTVGNRTYLRLSSNNATATNRTFCLTAGTQGQILVLELTAQAAEIADNSIGTCGGSPVAAQLTGTLTLGTDDTITLIYNGTKWLELATSNN